MKKIIKKEEQPLIERTQGQRVVESIENVGDFFKEIKKQQKWNLWLNIFWIAFLLVLFASAYGFAIYGEGLDALRDEDAFGRRYNCTSGQNYAVYRTVQEAKDFMFVFNGQCTIYYKGGGIQNGER